MAMYFAEHGTGGAREYQHQVQREWLTTVCVCTECGAGYDSDRDECPDCGCPDADVTEEGSVGRFWGYRGLHRELAIRQVTPEVGIAAGRIARRWYRAKGLTKTISVQRVEQSTGRVTYRRSTVRKELFKHGRGFVCVSDGTDSHLGWPATCPASALLAKLLCRCGAPDRIGSSGGGQRASSAHYEA